MSTIYAGIELGGTKVVSSLVRSDGEILERGSLPTTGPEETMAAVREQMQGFVARHAAPAAIGLATFGPVFVDPASPHFGCIGPSPKVLWRGYDLVAGVRDWFGVPVGLDTDVNGAALAESRYGAGRGCQSVVYITVGTGIGGGAVINGKPVHGLMHPEMGHIRVPQSAGDDFPGNCANHTNCVEGLAAGPAIMARWGCSLNHLAEGHRAYTIEADYLAQLLVNIVLLMSPERIVVGGGVMTNGRLYAPLRQRVRELLAGFVPVPLIEENIDQYIVPPGLGNNAGVLGAVALAHDALAAKTE